MSVLANSPSGRRRRSATRSVLAIGAASLLALTACGSDSASDGDEAADATPTASTRTFEDQTGEVTIPAEPTSIVACGYAVLPLIQTDAELSAVCEWTRELDNMDDESRAAYDALPKVAADGDVSTINYEAVAAAEPDLIILGVPERALGDVKLDELRAMAPVVVLAPEQPAQWRELGERYADAAGVADRYGDSREEYEALAAEIAAEHADTFEQLSFGGVCTPCGVYEGAFVREYASSYTSNLFDDLGADYPRTTAGPDADHSEEISAELLAESLGTVDVITYGVRADGSMEDGMQELFDSALWKSLPAVQAGRVIEVTHHSAATHATAIGALESIREQLAALPA